MGHSGAMRGRRLFHSLCTSDLSLPDQSRHPYLYPCLPEQSLLTLSKVWVPRDTPGTLRARVPTTVRMARAMGSSEWTQLPVQAPTGLRTQPFQMGKGAW